MAKRKALGKGLSAIIPETEGLEGEGPRFFQCPVEVIEPNPNQPRQVFSESELEEMATSVREKGVITPLLVRKVGSGYQLIAGERRWRAARKAGLSRIPVVVREASSTEALELALIENIHRKDLNPIEEAVAYRRLLKETGGTQEDLARRLGKDRSTITNLLRLLGLPVFVQSDVVERRLSMGHARVLAGVRNREEQRRLRDRIVKRRLSVRQAEMLAKKRKNPVTAPKKTSETDYYFQSLEEDLKRSLGTKVEIRRRGSEGRIVVYFYSDGELDRLLERFR